MFAKLKKKIAEEAATAPRSGVRIPRTISKESITSMGADSGDDFASDGSSTRDDLPAQILRRNDQIRKLEVKLSDYAEQLRLLQKTKDKLENALERHQDSSIKKLQEQSDSHEASRAKLAEGMALALEKKDQEWMEKMAVVEKEKASMRVRLEELMEQSLVLFQKREDVDELEGFQQQELAKVKHMLLRKEEVLSQQEQQLQQQTQEIQSLKRGISEAQRKLQSLERRHQESQRINCELEVEREELLLLREEADKKLSEEESRSLELQGLIHQVSEDFQKSQRTVSSLEESLRDLEAEHAALKLQQHKAAVTETDKENLLMELQRKVASLERRLQGNLSQDEHLQELLQEKSSLEQSIEETRAELLSVRTNHADVVSSLEAQVSRMSCSISEMQTLLRHKEESSRAYRERTDTQIKNLEEQLEEKSQRLRVSEQQVTERGQLLDKQEAEWSAEKGFLQMQLGLLEQQSEEKSSQLEESLASLQRDANTLQDRLADVERQMLESDLILRQRTEELQLCREELSSLQTVKTEADKDLKEITQQKEEQHKQIGELTASLQHIQQEVLVKEENIQTLQKEVESLQASLLECREEERRLRGELQQAEEQRSRLEEELSSYTQQLDACQTRISYLEVEVETLTEQLHSPPVCEEDQNGTLTVHDLDHIHKVNRELEQQLSDKNRTIRQLQQRLAQMKRTLQKELKLKPELESEEKEKLPESRAEQAEPPPPDPSPQSSNATKTTDLNESREINLEYLKHVVLKFLSSREAEAFQLIRAISVLLHFTREEEDMLKQTLEYKMSWFGSKPSPKGIIRPSISGSSSLWS